MSHVIRLLGSAEAHLCRAALADILIDAVEGGASVNFVFPMTRHKADAWWDGALASHSRGERLIFVAEEDGRIDGTVTLIPAPQENQPHRADISKMLVHRRARRRGLGTLLLKTAEDEARRMGRVLLTLDTETGSAGEELYAGLGWIVLGKVPGFALTADGTRREAATFFYKQL